MDGTPDQYANAIHKLEQTLLKHQLINQDDIDRISRIREILKSMEIKLSALLLLGDPHKLNDGIEEDTIKISKLLQEQQRDSRPLPSLVLTSAVMFSMARNMIQLQATYQTLRNRQTRWHRTESLYINSLLIQALGAARHDLEDGWSGIERVISHRGPSINWIPLLGPGAIDLGNDLISGTGSSTGVTGLQAQMEHLWLSQIESPISDNQNTNTSGERALSMSSALDELRRQLIERGEHIEHSFSARHLEQRLEAQQILNQQSGIALPQVLPHDAQRLRAMTEGNQLADLRVLPAEFERRIKRNSKKPFTKPQEEMLRSLNHPVIEIIPLTRLIPYLAPHNSPPHALAQSAAEITMWALATPRKLPSQEDGQNDLRETINQPSSNVRNTDQRLRASELRRTASNAIQAGRGREAVIARSLEMLWNPRMKLDNLAEALNTEEINQLDKLMQSVISECQKPDEHQQLMYSALWSIGSMESGSLFRQTRMMIAIQTMESNIRKQLCLMLLTELVASSCSRISKSLGDQWQHLDDTAWKQHLQARVRLANTIDRAMELARGWRKAHNRMLWQVYETTNPTPRPNESPRITALRELLQRAQKTAAGIQMSEYLTELPALSEPQLHFTTQDIERLTASELN